YAVQIVTDVPHFGGASGSTLNEAQSWGKVAADAAHVTVNTDATVALPLIVSALATSTQNVLDVRTFPAFDVSGQVITINGVPVADGRFSGPR
ncbi:uncharacterized protein METZ01_LOCUS109004, partial [marine metagenome]